MESIDIKIKKLFEIIQEKKAKLAKLERPTYNTSCSFSRYNENPCNLHVQPIESLVEILGWLTVKNEAFQTACKELNLDLKFEHLGKSYDNWKEDISTIINIKNITKEKRDLQEKENKLNQLISPEERRRLEVEALEKELE